MWLKAFCEVSVESVFDEADKKKSRKFLFDINNAVHDMCVEEVDMDVPRITQIRLMGLRGQYKSNEIPWITDEEKLEMELFKQEQKFKLELKREGKELEQELKEGVVDYQRYIQKRNSYAEKVYF